MVSRIGPIDPLQPYGKAKLGDDASSDLPGGTLLCDIVGVSAPFGCRTIREMSKVLREQGYVLLGGEILYKLLAKNHVRRTPLWKDLISSGCNCAVFAGIIPNFDESGTNTILFALGRNGDVPTTIRLSPDEAMPVQTKHLFAVRKRH